MFHAFVVFVQLAVNSHFFAFCSLYRLRRFSPVSVFSFVPAQPLLAFRTGKNFCAQTCILAKNFVHLLGGRTEITLRLSKF